MNLDKMVAAAKERLHRSIGQRARWALSDFRRDLNRLREAQRFLYPPR